MDALPFCCLYEAGDDAVGLEPFVGPGSEAHFSEDDHFAKGLLGMIVRRGHAGDAEKGEEAFLIRAEEIFSQGFGRLETKGLFADGLELPEKAFFNLRG